MQPHLLLIDALNLIRRIFAAVRAPDDYSRVDGAIASSLSSLSRAARDCQPTHTLVVFDGNPPTWRHELYPQYKEGRKPMPDALRQRLGDFNQAFLNNGFKSYRKAGLEADDVIAAVANKAASAGVQVTILSTDRVFFQLLGNPNITQRDHFQKLDFNHDTVVSQFSFEPEQLVDLWALSGVGDVPGVTGVGDKGASTLLKVHNTLSEILELGDSASGAAKKVVEQKEMALMSHKLARLASELELGLRLKDLRYEPATEAAGS
ncbi:hypothetical protein EOPP23_18675 [Endozoicomonas sp. OPT23]|uniref:5'-3' exonuclease H3TH domain-containing protein n=1 Tax=Endozoicomonas sp. OPT23 TaxID=2072845 RepID=UPI00129A9369|nr:5'-3' exonuclease H3TH domain-containing protein [Endozoicomonas sp. OPT23]MRI35004.1 hypothetical protein [Endozoicomonas sp. OPT23]